MRTVERLVQFTSLSFRTDVAARIAEGATVTAADDCAVVRSPDNPDFWWGNFLLLAAPPDPGSGGRWLARFAAEFPAARHIAIGIDTGDADVTAPDEFVTAGLTLDRATVLTAAAVREPPHLNSAAEIRPLSSAADWQQSLDLSIRSWGAEEDNHEYLKHRIAARRRLTREGHDEWFGAFDGGRLVSQLGLISAGDGLARYQDVVTDPAARRQGLAGTLVWHAGRYGLAKLGARTLVIVADPADTAIRVYRGCGFTDIESQTGFARG
jgi:GNAT superfamily N-acetyltransferase